MAFYNGYGTQIEIASGGAAETADLSKYEVLLPLSDRPVYHGYVLSSIKWSYTGSTSAYTYCLIPVTAGVVFSIIPQSGTTARLYPLKSWDNPVDGDAVDYAETGGVYAYGYFTGTSYSGTVPDGATYLAVQILNNGTDITPTTLIIDGIDYIPGSVGEVRDAVYNPGVNWVAFGDSITSGYYSYFQEDGTANSIQNGQAYNWSTLLAAKNHWTKTSKAVGGMGWVYSSSGASSQAYNQVQGVDFTQYNLVTFSYGVNDWKAGNVNFGELTDEASATPATVAASMKYCIETVMASNPACKIIVITPLNCRGYNYDFGDDSTCWGRGHAINGITLDEFADKMKAVCDLYGVECVDMTRYSCINKENIGQMLPDGVHPSIDCHALLARELAKKINFS